MNILLTSAGRRSSLLHALREAAQPFQGKIIAADLDPLAPALYVADAAEQVPMVRDERYISALLDIVARHEIRLLVPTIDTELKTLADHAEEFAAAGCRVHTSTSGFVEIAEDKWKTVNAFRAHDIAVPNSWLPSELGDHALLPERLFLKPRNGSASLHTYGIHRAELSTTLPRVPYAIVQQEIHGPELTIDAFISRDGRPIHFVPRLRLRTLAGESIQGVTVASDGHLGEWLTRVLSVAAELGARGVITLQIFDTLNGYILSEINPRFGGGFPLGYAAGGHYPQWLLQELQGEFVPSRIGQYQVGLYMTRANTEIFTQRLQW
ncbi:ATP-grasp domain-containing protein [Deinococcus ruber]|uniref:Carbamoyl phosphate synthase n=1 Tax=Deinococcus ruber TaxID=1848197 RepID=A0A918KX99_9DEIO|nr:ATP-grasp domain-containing protein [Deinococcus ruber]GGR39419.1 carbamoyl phosphate synthase [Deinococcus ruber]